jgi:RNA polymerase sigma-70 factor (ECF subfamily)
VEQFRVALETGNLKGLFDVLAPDVVLVADGGGFAQAFPRPISGADNIARVLARFPTGAPGAVITSVLVNGALALRIDPDGEYNTTVSLVVDRGRITHIYALRNPHKLSRLGTTTALSRS